MRTGNFVPTWLTHLLLSIGAFGMLYPLLWMLSSSFKPSTEIFKSYSLWPSEFLFDHYIDGWHGMSGVGFGTFYTNTLIIVCLVIVGTLISCSMTAYAFARLEFTFRNVWFALMMVLMMMPQHVVMIPQYVIFNKLNWVDSYLPLIVPKFLATEGFFIFLMIQFIRGLPRELDQAATVDGCGPVQIYLRLVLPLALPALVTTSIFTFIWTWNDFLGQLLYISNIKLYTVSLGLRMFLDSSGGESSWGPMFAMSILSLVPVFTVFIFFQRYLIEGITTGGLKG